MHPEYCSAVISYLVLETLTLVSVSNINVN